MAKIGDRKRHEEIKKRYMDETEGTALSATQSKEMIKLGVKHEEAWDNMQKAYRVVNKYDSERNKIVSKMTKLRKLM